MIAFRFSPRLPLISLAATVFFLAVPSLAAPPASHLAPPTGLRCAGQSEPLAVAVATPAFSWSLGATSPLLHGVSQSVYQIEVAASEHDLAAHTALLWDSGKVQSAIAANVVYAGSPLQPQGAYLWRVRVWDENGRPSAWSIAAHWRQAPEWHAQWIAARATDAEADAEPLPLFRKSFDLPGKVTRAVLYATGLGQDELRLNGRKVGNDELTPGWSDYRKTIYYESYDVTSMLRPGANALGVMLGNGMYHVQNTPTRYIKFSGSYGPPKCIVQLHLELAGGGSREISSDGTWKTHPGPITFSSTYGGEDYDARLEPRGWDAPGFDDAGWRPVLVSTSPGGSMRPEQAAPIRNMHTYATVRRTEPRSGVLVYDLGQNFAGWPEIRVSGPAGATVKLIPGELLNKDGSVSQRSSGEPQWFSYTLRGGAVEQWRPRFGYYGFRYVQVEGASADGTAIKEKARLLSLQGDAVHTSSSTVGSFASSDDLLNRIHTLILRAIENNSVSLFTDCPHREKLGWLEETHLLAPSMLYDFDFAGLYAATARNIADVQKTDGPKIGMVPEIAPQFVVFEPSTNDMFNDSPEWGSAAVLAPWYVYERTGDRAFLAAQLEVMRRYTDYLATRAVDGIIAYGLGDWYDIGPGDPGFSKLTTPGLTATATYYQDLRVLEKTTALLGDTQASRGFAERAEETRRIFNARFFDAAYHRYDKGSQTAQAMPLAIGLAPEGERKNVLDALVKDIRANNNHVTAGDIGYHYLVVALQQGGRSDVLLDMLRRTDSPSYGYQLAQGATALTEAWDANPTSSQDHFMLGHVEEWFYRGLGGIQVDLSASSPRQLVVHPQVADKLTWVRTRYDSSLGPVASSWTRGPSRTEYDIEIPANTSATVEIDTDAPDGILVNGLATAKAHGVLSAAPSGGMVSLVLASGRYRLSAANSSEKHP